MDCSAALPTRLVSGRVLRLGVREVWGRPMTEERVDFSGNRDIKPCRMCGSYGHGHAWHFGDTVTITIRREDAIYKADPELFSAFSEWNIAKACRAALEGSES